MSVKKIPITDFYANINTAAQTATQNYPHDVWIELEKPDATKPDKNVLSRQKARIETSLMRAANTAHSSNIVKQVLALIQSYQLVPKWDKQVMSTNGLVTFFNPYVCQALSDAEINAVLIHECGHQLYGDVVQSMELRMRLAKTFWSVPEEANTIGWVSWLENTFIDPLVNSLALEAQGKLIDHQFLEDHNQRIYLTLSGALTPCITQAGGTTGDMMLDGLIHNEQWDDMYNMINTSKQAEHDKWHILHRLGLLMARAIDGPPPNTGPSGGALGGINSNNTNNKNTVKAKQQAAVSNACKSAGTDPGEYGIEIPEPVESNQVQDHLPAIINGLYDSIAYSYEQVDPVMAQLGSFLPVREDPPGVVAVALDVSGSVVWSKEEFALLLGELTSALDHPQIESILLVPYDYGTPNPDNVRYFETGEDIIAELSEENGLSGGGGTDFTEAFKFIEEHEDANDFSCIINLTDGEADFDPDAHWNIPRIWVSTSRPTDDLDPTGTHVLLAGRYHGAVGGAYDDDDD